MNKKELFFEQINPFLRYAHFFIMRHDTPLVGVKAYDYRLMYVYDGKGSLVINGIKYNISKGHLLMWQPGINYSILPAPPNQVSMIGINFDFTYFNCEINNPIPPEKTELFNEQNITEIIEFKDMAIYNQPLHLSNMQFLESRLVELVNEYTIRKKYYLHKVRGSFLSVLCDISRQASEINTGTRSMDSKIDMIIQFIHEHYNKPITNVDVGVHFNFHPVYINRLMVKFTGFSLHQYLINYRISVAINLLQTTGKSVTEIAYSVGFKEINYFSKYFKKTIGISPKNFIAASPG